MDEDIVTRARTALAAVLMETAERCGGVVRAEKGLLLVAGNHPCPVLVCVVRSNNNGCAGLFEARVPRDHPLPKLLAGWVRMQISVADISEERQEMSQLVQYAAMKDPKVTSTTCCLWEVFYEFRFHTIPNDKQML